MTEIEKYDEAIRRERLLKVFKSQAGGATLGEACKSAGITPRSFHRWIAGGLLTDHLDQMRESQGEMLRAEALDAVPRVLTFLVEIATGERVARGASPVKAAQLVLQIAGVAPDQPGVSRETVNFIALIPQQARFVITKGAPVTEDGCPLIIDGEARELP
jgi:hypothetical protein